MAEACVVAGWTLGAHVIKRHGFDDVSAKDVLEYANGEIVKIGFGRFSVNF